MIDFRKFNHIISLTTYFNSEEKCKQAIIESRWADGDVVCPYCGQHHCVKRADGKFRCKGCRKNFSCLVGTIFENTKLPLIKWFIAMYFISSNKKGVSSYQLSRDIDVTQSTSWYMLQKIRLLYPQSDGDAFEGTVECDEVYIGGKEKWKHKSMRTPHTQGRSTKTKTPVFGMMERSSIINANGEIENITNVHAFVVDNTNKATLQPIIQQFVIEGFWSHFRRMISGCYHDVSDAHLQSYINEAVYRWNTRKMDESERFAHMFEMSIGLVRRWTDIKQGLMAA